MTNFTSLAERLLAHALSLPGAWEDHPWGETVAKVEKKVFLFLGKEAARAGELSFSVKLPESSVAALDRPESEPTGYGLGKSGWVTMKYARGDAPEYERIVAWIDESYRAIAPKKLVAAASRDTRAKPSSAPAKAKSAAAGAKKKVPTRKTPARTPTARKAASKPKAAGAKRASARR